jgi:hypothetical protein
MELWERQTPFGERTTICSIDFLFFRPLFRPIRRETGQQLSRCLVVAPSEEDARSAGLALLGCGASCFDACTMRDGPVGGKGQRGFLIDCDPAGTYCIARLSHCKQVTHSISVVDGEGRSQLSKRGFRFSGPAKKEPRALGGCGL